MSASQYFFPLDDLQSVHCKQESCVRSIDSHLPNCYLLGVGIPPTHLPLFPAPRKTPRGHWVKRRRKTRWKTTYARSVLAVVMIERLDHMSILHVMLARAQAFCDDHNDVVA